MQRAYDELARERKISAELAESRELLMREMHHRVGNNLQLLASLMALQKRQVSEPEAIRALDDASRRIGLIGRIQRQLHNAEVGELALGPFVEPLCRDLIEASGRQDIRHSFREEVRCQLSTDQAIPIALVIAEAVSNAIEHGFGADRGGHIVVSIARQGEELAIRIEDDGNGLPPDFTTKDRTSLGLTIATLLARRLGGQFRLEPGVGAVAVLTMPFPG
jgi:two-component sensor histidine kinase